MDINDGDEDELGFSRNYFLTKELGGPGKKSTRKVSDIDLVDEQELRAAAANIEPKHEKEISSLMNSYKSLFPKWLFELRCGFGLLMYGFGSKRALIEDFASTALTEYSVVVINGYLQSVNLKQVVVALAELWWDQFKAKRKVVSGNLAKVQQPFSSRSTDDLLAFLDGSQEEENDSFVCIAVHNIDGPALRDSESQQYLAQIASCSHIRIIASMDKNPDASKKWYFALCLRMLSFEVNVWSGTAQSAKTAAIVLQSLTPNAQSIFKVLVDYQLTHPDEEGMPFDDLYTTSRERFLVSSKVTLNSHLTEFKDHDLVKIRRRSDGQDCLLIPLVADALEKLLSELGQLFIVSTDSSSQPVYDVELNFE